MSRLIDPWTTVTVYNTRNQSDLQVLKLFLRRLSSDLKNSLLEFVGVNNVNLPTNTKIIIVQNKGMLLDFMLAMKGAKANVLERVYMLVSVG